MALAKSLMSLSRSAAGFGQSGLVRLLASPSRCFHGPAPRSVSLVSRQKLDGSFTALQIGRSFLTSSRIFAGSSRQVQTKSDLEMSDFLRDEVRAEKESLKSSKAVQVKGFDVTTNEAEVTLKKTFQGEQISVKVNVNHAVDADSNEDANVPEGGEKSNMICKPDFQVQLTKGSYTLTFNCSMRPDDEIEAMREGQSDDAPYEDLFHIVEFVIHKGEIKDSTYAMSGDVMDASFYDNLMNMLDERGVNTEFVHELVEFCTLYEQKLYVNLLEHLQEIVKSK